MAERVDLLVTGGRVVDEEVDRPADVAIRDGRIVALLRPGEPVTAGRTLDAAGCVLLPGLVDAHAHLREPGLTHKEDFSTGTHAAALGGVTTVLDMPTDEPWTATAGQLAEKMQSAQGRLHVDTGFQVALTAGLAGLDDVLALGPVSLELFTADVPEAFLFPTMDSVAEALARLKGADTLVGISPGDQSILAAAATRNRDGTVGDFLAGRPPLAEAQGVARAVLAAAATRARIHVRQVNSALGVATWARLRDLSDASVETTPQNLFFTAQDYAGSEAARLKASPPFRTAGDRAALRAALAQGVVDIVATDHAPHAPAEKAAPASAFADIPGGMPGLQTLLATMLRLVDEGVIALPDLARLCARNPAERFGLRRKGRIAPGFDADILALDPAADTRIATAEQVSKAGYTPFDGWTCRGRLRRVLLRGEEIVRDGALIKRGCGSVVTRNG
ncbi:MAG: dihydroorotase family protein [Alsobacter sp.]